jgi:hypothetical protein
MLVQHITQAPRPPSSVSEVSPELEAVILSLLEKAPEDRPQSAHAARESLERLRAG